VESTQEEKPIGLFIILKPVPSLVEVARREYFHFDYQKMGKLELRVAFDIIDETGSVVQAIKNYPNGLIIPLTANTITDKDCFMLENVIINRVSGFMMNEHLSHLFGHQDKDLKAPSNTLIYKSEELCFEYSLARIELQDLHNSDERKDQDEA
jgi:hypothetical protein